MQTKPKIVLFGSSHYVLPILKRMQQHTDITLVVTTETKATDAVPSFCNEHNLSFLTVHALNDQNSIDTIKQQHAEVAVLASFGLLIPQKVRDMFPKGIINIHPSLLPKYRGPTPVQSTILQNDTPAVSLMLLDSKLDHGPILAQTETERNATDTAESLYLRLFTIGADMLIELLDKYMAGEISPKEQNHSSATYTDHLTRENGYIDSTNPPQPEELQKMIRAYHPWPGVWTKMELGGKERIVKLLPENKLQVEGKKPMNIKDFLNGYPRAKEIISKLF